MKDWTEFVVKREGDDVAMIPFWVADLQMNKAKRKARWLVSVVCVLSIALIMAVSIIFLYADIPKFADYFR